MNLLTDIGMVILYAIAVFILIIQYLTFIIDVFAVPMLPWRRTITSWWLLILYIIPGGILLHLASIEIKIFYKWFNKRILNNVRLFR